MEKTEKQKKEKQKTETGYLYGSPDAAEITAQQPFAYWLDRVEKLGNAGKEKLVLLFGSPREVYCAKKSSLEAVLTQKQLADILDAKKEDVYREYEKLWEKGILFYPCYHEQYPKRLLSIPDRPFGIYVKGTLPKDAEKSAAIIGARGCSAYGRYVAEQFADGLASCGIQIISGMAKGIDSIAQSAALRAGGSTFAVLGCGVDICYPKSHELLYTNICETGGVLSIYPPGTAPLPRRFPPRNRIISGLSDVVLVIEARNKSGTLITVDMALEQGKEVYAVPGRVTDRLSDGCNALLLQGAGAALSPSQLMRELAESVWSRCAGGDREKSVTVSEEKGTGERPAVGRKAGERPAFGRMADQAAAGLSEQEKELLSLLDLCPISLDQIRIMMQTKELLCNLSLPQTMELLVNLIIAGLVQNEGGYYELKKPT